MLINSVLGRHIPTRYDYMFHRTTPDKIISPGYDRIGPSLLEQVAQKHRDPRMPRRSQRYTAVHPNGGQRRAPLQYHRSLDSLPPPLPFTSVNFSHREHNFTSAPILIQLNPSTEYVKLFPSLRLPPAFTLSPSSIRPLPLLAHTTRIFASQFLSGESSRQEQNYRGDIYLIG